MNSQDQTASAKPAYSREFEDLWFHLKSPVYFKGFVYMIEQGIRVHQLFKMQWHTEEIGKPLKPYRIGKTVSTHGVFKTMCAFRDELYVFSDRNVGGGRYEIRYHRIGNPESGQWFPGSSEPDGRNTGLSGEYSDWFGRGAPQSLQAVEFDDRIYLFYFRARRIYYATFDGQRWKENPDPVLLGGIQEGDTRAIFYAIPVSVRFNGQNGYERRNVICVAGSYERHQGWVWLHWVDSQNRIFKETPRLELGAERRDDQPLSLAFGVIDGEPGGDAIQTFCNGRDTNRGLQRKYLLMGESRRHGEWSYQGIKNQPRRPAGDPINLFCDTVIVPLRDGSRGGAEVYYLLVVTANTRRIDDDITKTTTVLSSYRLRERPAGP